MNHLWPVMRYSPPGPPSPAGSAVVVLARTSVPPCFSVMPMPMVTPRLAAAGLKARVVLCARGSAAATRRELRLQQQRRHRGVGHGHRAAVPGFHLRRHVEAGRARDVGAGVPRLGACLRQLRPRPSNAAPAHAAAHQRVVGRMELDHVEPAPLAVVRAQLRRLLVGEPAALQRLGAAATARSAERSAACAAAFAVHRVNQRRSDAKRFTSSNGGGWLNTSWVVNRVGHGRFVA